jgi:hypothetical protein
MWVPINKEPKAPGWLRQQRWRRLEEDDRVIIFKIVERLPSTDILYTYFPVDAAPQKPPTGAGSPLLDIPYDRNNARAVDQSGLFNQQLNRRVAKYLNGLLGVSLPAEARAPSNWEFFGQFGQYHFTVARLATSSHPAWINFGQQTISRYRLPCNLVTGPRYIGLFKIGNSQQGPIHWGEFPITGGLSLGANDYLEPGNRFTFSEALSVNLSRSAEDLEIIQSRQKTIGGTRIYEIAINVRNLLIKSRKDGLGRYVGVILSAPGVNGFVGDQAGIANLGNTSNPEAYAYSGPVLRQIDFTVSAQIASKSSQPSNADPYVSRPIRRLGQSRQLPGRLIINAAPSFGPPAYFYDSSAVFEIDTYAPPLSRWITPTLLPPVPGATEVRTVGQLTINTTGPASYSPSSGYLARQGQITSSPWAGYQI